MTNKEEIVNLIKSWIKRDDDIKLLQSKIKEIKNEKKKITENLLEIMKNNDIDCFDIENQKIIFCTKKSKESLNKKYLLSCLEKYFENDSTIDSNEVTNFILDNRNIKISENIRRK